jgi:integrase
VDDEDRALPLFGVRLERDAAPTAEVPLVLLGCRHGRSALAQLESLISRSRRTDADALLREEGGRGHFRALRRGLKDEALLSRPGQGKAIPRRLRAKPVETAPKWAPSTRDLYGRVATKYVYPSALQAISIRDLTPADPQAFLDDAATKTGARTVEILRNLISGTLARQVKLGQITTNPCARLELAEPVTREAKFLTVEEVEAIADSIYSRYRALVLTAAYAALRFVEAAGLRKRDLRLLERRIDVTGSIVQVGSDVSRSERTKTKDSRREVAIPAFLVGELARHLALYPVASKDDLIFPAPGGGPLSRTLFRNRTWVPALQKVGLGEWTTEPGRTRRFSPGARFHDLRHTGVSLAIKANTHPLVLSRWVGHKSITATLDRYGHLYAEVQEERADALDALRARAKGGGEVVGLSGDPRQLTPRPGGAHYVGASRGLSAASAVVTVALGDPRSEGARL